MKEFNTAWYQPRYTDLKLHKILNSAPAIENISENKLIYSNEEKKDNNGAYLIQFKILNKEKNVLVYNYISYHEMFSSSLLTYLTIKPLYTRGATFTEWGDFFTIIDSNIHCYLPEIKEEYYLFNEHLKAYIERASPELLQVDNYISLFDVTKKCVMFADNQGISYLMDLALKRNYLQFFNFLFSRLDYDLDTLEANNTKNDLNLLKDCLFVVKDLDLFINNIQNTLKGEYNINQGPQKLRGHVNGISNALNLLDLDFRVSLFNQITHHYNCGNLDPSFADGYLDANFNLKWKNYSFRNVHTNLGNIKW